MARLSLRWEGSPTSLLPLQTPVMYFQGAENLSQCPMPSYNTALTLNI